MSVPGIAGQYRASRRERVGRLHRTLVSVPDIAYEARRRIAVLAPPRVAPHAPSSHAPPSSIADVSTGQRVANP
eukprot:3108679-Rhodomonas_salina.3